MKNLLFLLALTIIGANSFGQTTLTNSLDTLKQSTTIYSTSAKQVTPFDAVSIQTVLTKVSGTPTGNIIPQGSIDGTNYVDISTDTLKLANQTTNTKIWTFDKTRYLYYRVASTATSTTQQSTQKVYLLGRFQPHQ